MANFYAQYPPSASGGSNASVGTNTLPAPTSSTQVAGVDSFGNLQALKVDSFGNLLVDLAFPVIVSENVAQFGGNNVVTGLGASGLGIPRVTVSNDSNILATQSGVWNVNNISGTVSLPTGASTSALQTSGNASLTLIQTQTSYLPTALGQMTMANSFPVVLASDQSSIPVTLSGNVTVVQPTGTNLHVVVDSSALPTGASTAANQATEITALGTINTTLGTPMQQSGGSVTANAGTNLNTSALALESTQSAFQAANHTDLTAINTTLGSPFQAGGSIANTSFVANAGTNLNTSALNLESTQSAFQAANHTDLVAINTTLGTPLQAGGSVIALSTAGAVTDGSGNTSATPSTSTQIFAANASRKYLLIQNLSLTDKIYIKLGAAADTTSSIVLGPDVGEGGGSFVMESSFISNQTVNVLCASASQPYMAEQG